MLLAPIIYLLMISLNKLLVDRLIIVIADLRGILVVIIQEGVHMIGQIIPVALPEHLQQPGRPRDLAQQADLIGEHPFDRLAEVFSQMFSIAFMGQLDKGAHCFFI